MKLLYLGFFSILKYQVSTLVYNNFVFVLDFYISDYVRFHPAYSVEFRRRKKFKMNCVFQSINAIFTVIRYPKSLYSIFTIIKYLKSQYSIFTVIKYQKLQYSFFTVNKYPKRQYSLFTLYCH